MSVIPCYAIGIAIIIYSIFVYSPFIPSLFTYVISKNQALASNKQRTAALEFLVDAPTIGQFFYQELITNCMLQNKWEKVLNYSNHALQYPVNKNSFTIWYYKATAECLMSLLEDCQRSARIANGLFPTGHEQYVSQLFSLAKIMKGKKNLKIVTNDNQIMIVADSTQNQAEPKLQEKKKEEKGSQIQQKSLQKQSLKQFITSKQGQQQIMKTLTEIFPDGVISQISQIKQIEEMTDPTIQPQVVEESQQKLDEVNLAEL